MQVLHFQFQGSRHYQEDSFYIDDEKEFFLVCDGLGGSTHGDLASQSIIYSVHRQIRKKSKPFVEESQINAIFQQAWEDLIQKAKKNPETYRMGTTMVGAFFTEKGMRVAHLGDSRLYHIRPGEGMKFCTKDHSLVQEMYDKGLFDSKQSMEEDPRSHQVSRAFVAAEEYMAPEVDHHFIEDLQNGDVFILCSDGVIETFKGDLLVPILASTDLSFEEKRNKIATECKEKSNDNSTALLIEFEFEFEPCSLKPCAKASIASPKPCVQASESASVSVMAFGLND